MKFTKHIISLVALLLLLVVSCIEILNINQPDTATIGETITITVDAEVTGKDGSTLVFGFLVPKEWKAKDQTTVSVESSIGNTTMSLMPDDEIDANMNRPWAEQLNERVGFGGNYGDVEWIVFKADTELLPPDNTDETNPVTGTITIITTVGQTNMKANLGYFLGEAFWGYLKDSDKNSTHKFASKCIEIVGGSGGVVNLCGPAPRQFIESETFTFNDILTIVFDAQEDNSALVGADKVYFCSIAEHDFGTTELCEYSSKTEMKYRGGDVWELTIWPKAYFDIPTGSNVTGIKVNFQNENGQIIVKDINTNEDFEILSKCF